MPTIQNCKLVTREEPPFAGEAKETARHQADEQSKAIRCYATITDIHARKDAAKAALQTKEMADQSVPGAVGNRSSRARILLAEDDPMVRQVTLLALKRYGRFAEVAENGREAVRKWEQGEFDLILMDVQMPEMTGIEATQKIRERESLPARRTAIVGVTAHTGPGIREACLQAGMDRVLTKPVKIKELEAVIADCLGQQAKRALP